jgi:hypothetical protein
LLARGLQAMRTQRFIDWSFGHYLRIAHPDFATSERRQPALSAS